MAWKELTDEIVNDVAQIRLASPETETIIAIIKYQGRTLGGCVFQPNIFTDVGFKMGDAPVVMDAVMVMADPAKPASAFQWRPVDLPPGLKRDGDGDAPLFYYTVLKDRRVGVAVPARYHDGHLGWSHNPDVIDSVNEALTIKSGGEA